VTIDGKDLSRVRLDSYRSALGVVLQDSFLFDGSIENIAFSRPDATDEEILEACRIAHVATRWKKKAAGRAEAAAACPMR
jgi:subfamily B ATP-binding cassette protein MsbA